MRPLSICDNTTMALSLPPEILDNIFQLVDISPKQLLICRAWYPSVRRRFLEDIRLSPAALLRIPILSDQYMELLYSHTRSVSIMLSDRNSAHIRRNYATPEHLMPYSGAWIYGINIALTELATKIRMFRRLRLFAFCNHLEVGSSWNVVKISTFEKVLSGVSSQYLEFVKIDFPGAELENRLQIYDSWTDKPHACEIISRHFPRSRHVYIRMREICSHLLKFEYTYRPMLETYIIDLSFETHACHELDMDRHVLNCQFTERFGLDLMKVLALDARRLSKCPKIPNMNVVQLLSTCPEARESLHSRSSDNISYTERGAIWTIRTNCMTCI